MNWGLAPSGCTCFSRDSLRGAWPSLNTATLGQATGNVIPVVHLGVYGTCREPA